LAKRTLYELEPGNVSAATVKRARESIDAVNAQVVELVARSWGRR
jgi:chromosome partitioning protein